MIVTNLKKSFSDPRLVLYFALLCLFLTLSGCDQASDKSANLADRSEQLTGQVVIQNYREARGIFWRDLYSNGGETLYCQTSFKSYSRKGLNVEHVFPMSWVTKPMGCGTRKQCRRTSDRFNQAESDMHNLFPARTEVNAARSSFRFAILNGESRNFGKHCDFEVDVRIRAVEPRPEVRGDIARAMFYMAYEYRRDGLKIFSKSGRLLQQWHHADLPDTGEITRNTRIASLQGNRNPFIDNPSLLDEYIRKGVFY